MVSLLLNFSFCSCILSLISFSCLCSLIAHWASLRWLFWIFAKQFRDLHSFKVDHWGFFGLFFLYWYVFLILHDPCSLALMSVHLKKNSPLPDLTQRLSLSLPWGYLWAEEICLSALLYQLEMRGALDQ